MFSWFFTLTDMTCIFNLNCYCIKFISVLLKNITNPCYSLVAVWFGSRALWGGIVAEDTHPPWWILWPLGTAWQFPLLNFALQSHLPHPDRHPTNTNNTCHHQQHSCHSTVATHKCHPPCVWSPAVQWLPSVQLWPGNGSRTRASVHFAQYNYHCNQPCFFPATSQ